jgi:hypothetical protein
VPTPGPRPTLPACSRWSASRAAALRHPGPPGRGTAGACRRRGPCPLLVSCLSRCTPHAGGDMAVARTRHAPVQSADRVPLRGSARQLRFKRQGADNTRVSALPHSPSYTVGTFRGGGEGGSTLAARTAHVREPPAARGGPESAPYPVASTTHHEGRP